jgi:uncharacterized protein
MEAEDAREKRFAVDHMLGKVAKWLRVLGFDVLYESLLDGEQIERLVQQGYIIITRTQKWCSLPRVLCPGSNDSMEQFREVVASALILPDEIRPLHRCIRCNQWLESLSRSEAFGLVPDFVFETQVTFHRCAHCGRVYWPGSHSRRMMAQIRRELGWPLENNQAKED